MEVDAKVFLVILDFHNLTSYYKQSNFFEAEDTSENRSIVRNLDL